MNNFSTLYQYECKKLTNKRLVWISFALCVAAIIISLCVPLIGSYYVNGEVIDTHYNLYQQDKQYSEALNGREISQNLLEETVLAYRKIPATAGQHYTLTEEYNQYARPYSAIFNFIVGTTSMTPSEVMLNWQPNESDLYAKRQKYLNASWEEMKLSEDEMDFWQEREMQIKPPFIYQEHSVYDTLLSTYQTLGLLVLLLISICLTGIFSDEHTRKTDQIILSCPLGKTKLYWAKIMAGISFASLSTILLCGITFIVSICVYGSEGFKAAFQLLYVSNSDPITCGQAIMIAYGNLLITAVATSVFVMVLSELLHSNIATLAVSTVLLILPMVVNVPEHYRMLAQIWNWLPWGFLAPWNVFGKYTISLFAHHLTPWQAVPILYIILGIAISLIGKPIYKKYQICGR